MTKTTTRSATPQQQIAILKHLAGGKDIDTVAEILNLTHSQVIDFAGTHGYPNADKMLWAVDILAKKLVEAETTLPAGSPHASEIRSASGGHRPIAIAPTPTTPDPAPVAKPDEIRILLNTAKAHPSKRIQAAADRVFDQLDRVRALIREDQEKHAAKRAEAAAKEKARAEVKRLEAELAAARAKLRGTTAAATPSADGNDVPAKVVREWAVNAGVECPATGKLPAAVRAAYDDAHQDGAA